MRVPIFKEEKSYDDPLLTSIAEPYCETNRKELINIVARKYGQQLLGDMVPFR